MPRSKLLPGVPGVQPALVFHFSEDPEIRVFRPRPGRAVASHPEGTRLVWAIDEQHAPLYYFPRQCPRIVLWALEDSTGEDIRRWMGESTSRMIAHIEKAWLERVNSCRLSRYTFDAAPFVNIHDHGAHVSPVAVRPISVEPMDDLPGALAAAGVELRVVDSLLPLAGAWHSTLHFSGIRLKNASGWRAPA